MSLFLFLQSGFTLLLGPFTFFNAQKTKYLQILTSLMRWIGKKKPQYFHFVHPALIPSSPSPLPHIVSRVVRSVHHGSVLLGVFDSHLPSFLTLTDVTARPRLDWTVTHEAAGENKPPVLEAAVKITASLNHCGPRHPHTAPRRLT